MPGDLVIELPLVDQTAREFAVKRAEYFASGTRHVWIVDHEAHNVTTYDAAGAVALLTGGDTLTGGDVLPGFSLPLATLFAGFRRP